MSIWVNEQLAMFVTFSGDGGAGSRGAGTANNEVAAGTWTDAGTGTSVDGGEISTVCVAGTCSALVTATGLVMVIIRADSRGAGTANNEVAAGTWTDAGTGTSVDGGANVSSKRGS